MSISLYRLRRYEKGLENPNENDLLNMRAITNIQIFYFHESLKLVGTVRFNKTELYPFRARLSLLFNTFDFSSFLYKVYCDSILEKDGLTLYKTLDKNKVAFLLDKNILFRFDVKQDKFIWVNCSNSELDYTMPPILNKILVGKLKRSGIISQDGTMR